MAKKGRKNLKGSRSGGRQKKSNLYEQGLTLCQERKQHRDWGGGGGETEEKSNPLTKNWWECFATS